MDLGVKAGIVEKAGAGIPIKGNESAKDAKRPKPI